MSRFRLNVGIIVFFFCLIFRLIDSIIEGINDVGNWWQSGISLYAQVNRLVVNVSLDNDRVNF
jgi:hypothetical protein